MSHAIPTSDPLTGQPSLFPMSSVEGSPVKTSATRANGRALQGAGAASGRSFGEPLCHYNLASSSWRTSQLSINGDLIAFSATWPRAGTMRNGIVCPQRPLVPRICGSASSLWPTATVSDGTMGIVNFRKDSNILAGGKHSVSLTHMVHYRERFPTPRAFMHKDSSTDRGKGNLGEVVGGQLNPPWVEWLMGFPIGWTDLKVSATPSSPKSLRKSDG